MISDTYSQRKPTPSPPEGGWPVLGVVIVNYLGKDFIRSCLESVFATNYPALRVVLVDNASPDDSVAVIKKWASGEDPFEAPDDWPFPNLEIAAKPIPLVERSPDDAAGAEGSLTLIHAGDNLGFAGGVNKGLRALRQADAEFFWILNPDAVTPPHTPFQLAVGARKAGQFGLIGNRTVHYDDPGKIHTDGGRFIRPFGFVKSVNYNAPVASSKMPTADEIDFVPGCSMLASRAFLDQVGPMDEKFFLYFEEIDWAMRRGDLPLVVVEGAEVLHQGGGAIGTGATNRLPSTLAAYFTHRNLLPFCARWATKWLPLVYLVAWYRMVRYFLHPDAMPQFFAALRGLHMLGPPGDVKARLPAIVARTGNVATPPNHRVW